MGIPTVEKMEIYPVAGHDCMELNLSGAHAPYFTRNIVILTDSNGVEGVGEVPGGEKITKALEDVKHLASATPGKLLYVRPSSPIRNCTPLVSTSLISIQS